jgi:sugar phosphate permease
MQNTPQPTKKDHWLAKRTPFFYGWIILPISIIAAVFTSPGQTFMVSIFNPSFRETLDLSLTELTGAYMIGTLLASLPQSYIGVWADRLGIRKVLLMIVSLFSLACVFISQVNSLPMLFLAFFFLRLLGQGALELMSVNMLPMWFNKTLGTISGVRNVAVNLLIGAIPLGVLGLINRIGWRNTYVLAGAVVFSIMLPIAIFFYINRPEEIGQTLDGKTNQAIEDENNANASIPETALNLKAALKTRAFWILSMTWFAWAGIATAITFNLLPIFTAKGLTEEQAASTFIILMVISSLFQIVGGALADRIPLNRLAFGGPVLYSAAIVALITVPASAVVLAYTLILGVGQGMFGGLGTTVWVRYFGREHLGKIRGAVWTAGVAGSSIGPFLMGVSYDTFGDFFISLVVCAVFMFGLAIANLWATPPRMAKI